MTKAHYVGLGD